MSVKPVQKYWTVRRLCGVHRYATCAEEDGHTVFLIAFAIFFPGYARRVMNGLNVERFSSVVTILSEDCGYP